MLHSNKVVSDGAASAALNPDYSTFEQVKASFELRPLETLEFLGPEAKM